jgi:hypothetical protein
MKLSTVETLINECKMITVGEGGRKAALGFFAVGTPQYNRLVKGVKEREGIEVVGVLVGERLVKHPDSLSVSGGIFIRSTDSRAVETKHAVVARRTGEPVNVASICGLDKPCDLVVRMLGLGSAV